MIKLIILGIISGIVTGLGMGRWKYFDNFINGIFRCGTTFSSSRKFIFLSSNSNYFDNCTFQLSAIPQAQ